MPLTYYSDELVAAVKTLGAIPSNATSLVTGGDTEILGHLTDVLQTRMAEALLQAREEYFVASSRVALTSASTYRIPHRAWGQKLRDIYYVSGSDRIQLDPVSRENLHLENGTSSAPNGYYLEGNYVQISPALSGASGFLEFSYYFRPSDLVLQASARQITVVDAAQKQVTIASAQPGSWQGSVSMPYDIHSKLSGAEVKYPDIIATNFTNSVVTFATDIDGSVFGTKALEKGDWMCLAGESVIPALPRELHSVLVRGACARIAESFGDAQQVQMHGAIFENDLKAALKVLEQRVESKPMRVTGQRAVLWC